jgi:hypothetical protein
MVNESMTYTRKGEIVSVFIGKKKIATVCIYDMINFALANDMLDEYTLPEREAE